MTSSGQLAEYRTGPLYFFDQPRRRNRVRGTRSNILHFNGAHEGAQSEDKTQSYRENDNKESDELTKRLSGETCGDSKPDTSSAVGASLNTKDHSPVDAYKRAAPQILNELARLLSQHKWTEEGCIPHGVVNILNYSWQDVTAGVVHPKSPEHTPKRRRSKGSWKLAETPRQVSANGRRETGERSSCVVGSSGPSERKPKVSINPRVKKRKQNSSEAHNSSTVSFSISSSSCKDPGWIIQPKQPSYDEPQQISLCQWVVERLHAARNPEKLQTAGQNLKKPLVLRHYGEARAKLKDGRARRKAQPATLVNGIPQIPKVKQQDPARQKLHYRIDDGSSFIYYPSGCMAVCQSHSGLSYGGFYTNVFSDSEFPVMLATITAFGRGAVTHPLSSSITAVWDQDGGLISDHYGNITKEWSWQTDRALKEKIVIQLSDLISVMLLSGTSAMLSFRCNNESVQLPLSALPNINQSKETLCLQTDAKFTSDAAQDILLARTTKSPAVVLQSKRNLTVSVCSREVSQMVREMEGLEEPSARWRRGGLAGRELKKLQKRVRNTLEDWLDYYRAATGIKCPDTERMPAAPLRTRLRREVQSAALPSLNPPEWADAKPNQPEECRTELQELHRHLSASAERPADSSVRLPRTTKKRSKEEPHVTQIGPLQIHGNIKLESVIIPKSPESQPAAVTRCPAPSSLTPSVPLTVCPVLLRAALLGEGRRRRCCCCSVTLMPVVTDLEYDTFVMGQPPHSQQILVVCVTLPRQPISNTHAVPDQEALEQLYRRRNKHRTMPCSQCQMDSFRLVRYEMSTEKLSCGSENILLQQRHNASPGMVLMYIRGKLLFVGYIFSGRGCSVRDLQKQISRTRGDYRLGLSLPPDYKFSDTGNNRTATDAHNSQHATLKEGDGATLPASVEKAKERRTTEASHRRHRGFCIKPKKKTPAFPHVPVISH
uniref:FAM194 C-terminal domain-containing protein n=1 Tax=Seriola dumerili TaxID=41447 RepID=A0A3B4VKR3_SERDU